MKLPLASAVVRAHLHSVLMFRSHFWQAPTRWSSNHNFVQARCCTCSGLELALLRHATVVREGPFTGGKLTLGDRQPDRRLWPNSDIRCWWPSVYLRPSRWRSNV